MVNLFTIQPPRYAEKLFVEHNTQATHNPNGSMPRRSRTNTFDDKLFDETKFYAFLVSSYVTVITHRSAICFGRYRNHTQVSRNRLTMNVQLLSLINNIDIGHCLLTRVGFSRT